MIPVAFEYVRAGSAEEALAALSEHGDEAKLMAGGHSLLPMMKLRLAYPSVIVDIGRLNDLSYINDAGDHLAIGALRTVGIPARYVSGYLHPSRSSAIGETVQGESHAWVEWWAGDWLGYDPTNDSVVADHHVVVARAREYADVMPVKGIFTGADSELTVSVDVTQVA